MDEQEQTDIQTVRDWCRASHVDDRDALISFNIGRGVFDDRLAIKRYLVGVADGLALGGFTDRTEHLKPEQSGSSRARILTFGSIPQILSPYNGELFIRSLLTFDIIR